MTQAEFAQIERFMQASMQDAVHDQLHVYRVLNYALQIAEATPGADMDVVIISALLHDIGRAAEMRDPSLCHARVGSQMAHEFLLARGDQADVARRVADCIRTHRYKNGAPPQSPEARILFDADKLDLIGTVGVARAILFGGQIDEPLYLLDEQNDPTEGLPSEGASLFREYNRKLSSLWTKLYTAKAREIAKAQQKTMDAYFQSLFQEVKTN
ncbi:MAG: HD domain-containing protein, partial [Clostridia bacterium]